MGNLKTQRKSILKKVAFLLLILPMIFIFMIFILINEKHKQNPERLACSSFQTALRKSVPLYVSESDFKMKTEKMCQCLFNENVGETIDYGKMGNCSKLVIFDWIMPSKKFKTRDSELCFKKSVYKEIIFPFVKQELDITFSKGVFRNDILNADSKKSRKRNEEYQYLLNKCNN